ncbi:hypothetical protein CEP88_18290 [Roseobacter denitrificans]|uniref:Uncharacterized protein n=1 Tax=Roseobacter denitrificans (strain ATCC 33942 / OCh 114) TaxID=375451 RepID=Q169M6_ROSDO|nr:DUF6522 family protein [Roseobacter denitrificans]ABG31317.1 hypothetical protein RD1_1693 [Roseobacter denitrificans OCh 114]AVL54352.1 hypothetical protein CEP88_18290 [Roseobacter denitrificans]SFF99435.1 hypothetical protein SAMN05443635_105140 [Roseobacter denitrificans OCh 114]
MKQVEINESGFVVDATLLAEAFALEPGDVQGLMRKGEITSLSETGVGEDAGRARLTFHYGDRALRLVVDQTGAILKRTSFTAKSRTPARADIAPEV